MAGAGREFPSSPPAPAGRPLPAPAGARRAHTHFLTISEHTLAARPPAAPQLLSPARRAARRGRPCAKLRTRRPGMLAAGCGRRARRAGWGARAPAPGLGGCPKEEKRQEKVRQRCPLFLCYNPACERARECLCASVCVPICARVWKRMPVCAGQGRPGAAGPEGAGRPGGAAEGTACRVFLTLRRTRASEQVAVPLSPASRRTELGVCSQTSAARGRRGAPAWARPAGVGGVEPPAEHLP